MADIFGNADAWRVYYDATYRPAFESGTPDPGGPAGWHNSLAFDDSAWAVLANGCGSVGAGASSPDGRSMPGFGGQTAIKWNSAISPNGTNFGRRTFTVTQQDIDNRIVLSTGAQFWGTVWVNGVQVHNAGATGVVGAYQLDISSYCSPGENLLAIRSVDQISSFSGESSSDAYGEGAVFDTVLWARIWTLGPAEFVAAGVSAKVAFSSDGSTWTQVGAPFTATTTQLNRIAYSPDQETWLAIQYGTLFSSTDGLTWTQVTVLPQVSYALAWSTDLSLWVVGGYEYIATSPDGVTWTTRTSGLTATGDYVYRALWVSEHNKFYVTTLSGRIMSSPDGITWTLVTNTGVPSGYGLTYSPALDTVYASGGSTGVGYLYASTDGGTSFSAVTPPFASQIYSVCWSSDLGLLVAAGNNGNLYTSPDGSTWTSRTSNFGTQAINDMAWSSTLSLFVAVGSAGTMTTSPDGTTWTTRTSSFGSSLIRTVAAKWSVPVVTEVAALGRLSYDGLHTIDISDPTSPTLLDSFEPHSGTFTGEVVDITWYGNYIVCLNNGDDSLFVIDATDPSNLVEAGHYKDTVTYTELDQPKKVRMMGDYAVVTNNGSKCLYVFDLSDPTTPTLVGSYDRTGDINGFNNAWGLAIVGTTAVVGSGNSPNILTFDLSNPASPVRGTFLNDLTGGTATNIYGIEPVSGSIVAVIVYSGSQSGLFLLDIDTMTVVGSIKGTSTSNVGRPEGLSVSSDGLQVVLACPANDRVTFVDISNQASPSVIGSYQSAASLDIPYSLDFTNDDAYACVPGLGTGNFAVVSNGATPALSGNLTGFGAFTPYIVSVRPPVAPGSPCSNFITLGWITFSPC